MSNSKKNWNTGKAKKREVDANKKTLKMNASEARATAKRIAKGKI